ncbi:824_t:CDS:2 [Diversispora eburnea]|uniref:824_t:CDS:1 n=1 Tax=Diversispora eburnea TaxID=1213867 RepID=A0A9N9D5H8_9GLOM|nr:824_t:CDS:2 [Diversispora eburnea]
MTKQKLQQELLEEVKEGVKPSDLKKKLKRSKSLGDIPKAPPLPTQPNIQQLQQENEKLKKQVENLKEKPNPRIAELEKELEQTHELEKGVKALKSEKEYNKNARELIQEYKQALADKEKKSIKHSHSTQTDPDPELETTLDNLLQSIQDLNNQIK